MMSDKLIIKEVESSFRNGDDDDDDGTKELFQPKKSSPHVLFPTATPLDPKASTLASGGPTNPSPRAIQALTLPILGTFDAATDRLLADIQAGLRALLGTRNEYTLALHGTGVTGMTCVLDNLIDPGELVLICSSGFWGDVAASVVDRLGGIVARERKPLGVPFTKEEVKGQLNKHKPSVLFMVNGDTSTGLYQKLDGIGELCRAANCMFVVDVAGTVGQQPVEMDRMGIDAAFANSQKGIGGIVGLAPVSFSPRAMRRARGKKVPPKLFPTDIPLQGKLWNIEGGEGEIRDLGFVHSISFPLLYMLREALGSILDDEGLENYWNRHTSCSDLVYKRAGDIGLKCVVSRPEDRLRGTFLFHVPQGKDIFKIEQHIRNKHQLAISPGWGRTFGRAIRIGLFGPNASDANAERVMDILKNAVSSKDTDMC